MPDSAHAFLTTLALVLCTAAVTTVLFQRLKQPVILGYLVAGLLVGPHVTIVPVVADHQVTESLAELGMILLLFAIGLEFSLRKLVRVGGTALATGVIAISLIFWLGHGVARLLGWTGTEAVFTGAAIAISSTTIVGKAFDEFRVVGKIRDLVFGVLIIEDLFSILILAGLSTLAAGKAASVDALGWSAFRLLGLLAIAVTVGLVVVPRTIRWVVRLNSPETTLVASVGLCFAGALLAQAAGYSVALGAFLAGSLIAESGKGERVVKLVQPVRDVFGAVFFVSVGMLIEPALVREHWGAVAIFTLLVVVGQVVAVSLGAFLAGSGTRTALQAGMSMGQIGEFSFIIVGLGATSGVVGAFLYPVMVAVSAITTLITPWMIRASPRAAAWVDRKLPRPLQTFAALYGTWIADLRAAPDGGTRGARVRLKLRWLLLDAVCIAAIIIGVSVTAPDIAPWLTERMPLSARSTNVALIGVGLALSAPFLFGLVRMAREIAEILAHSALPSEGKIDRAAAPRGTLVVAIEILLLLVIGLPIVAVTEPFLPPFRGGVVLLVFLLFLMVAAWRSATNLQGHVTAGAELLMEAVRSTLPPEHGTVEMAVPTLEGHADRFQTATHMLPGIGAPTPFRVQEHHFGVGRSLAELGLRGRTGATVLAITRDGVGIPAPSKTERLEANDTLILVGTREAVQAARELLERG